MRMRLSLLALLSCAAGCSLLIDTGNPTEGRPCKEGQCASGYVCSAENVCVAGSAPADAAVAGKDAALPGLDASEPGLDAGEPGLDAGPGKLTLKSGGLGTLGERPAGAGGMRVVDDGFEFGARTCAGTTCVTGGIIP